jgi:hypothetical protein
MATLMNFNYLPSKVLPTVKESFSCLLSTFPTRKTPESYRLAGPALNTKSA